MSAEQFTHSDALQQCIDHHKALRTQMLAGALAYFDCSIAPSDPHQFPDVDIEALLSKYGPEGLHELGARLQARAKRDAYDAMEQSDLEIGS